MMNYSSEQISPASLRKCILRLSNSEACDFLLKAESYCNIELPPYFIFTDLIKKVNDELMGTNPNDLFKKSRDHEDVNYTILDNKDGKYAWRPFELIHPVLYVSLVREITKKDNWELIKKRFKEFKNEKKPFEELKNEKIKCLSIPVVSLSEKKDRAEQVSYWWQEVEQRSIELALEYDYLLETDITNCYGSIYTHSIAWALHTKTEAKEKANKNNLNLIGNQIDKHIQGMHHGQTNGIPQGSTLMDLIAEMVLGYADIELSEKIQSVNITDYFILRYRDDYRIFSNNPRDSELILKALTEVMLTLGLKLNSHKTKASDDVVRASMKTGKIAWDKINKSAWYSRQESEKGLHKHLLSIHDHALNFPNSGSLLVALRDYYQRLSGIKKLFVRPQFIISIVTDIAFRNPRTYAVCSAILSKLLSFLEEQDKRTMLEKIKSKFKKIPHTGYIQIWLQRITYPAFKDIQFEEPLCKLASGKNTAIWNVDWITSAGLKAAVDTPIIDKKKIERINPIISAEEFELFINY